MKTKALLTRGYHGGILMTTLVLGGVLGLALGAALSWSSFHNRTTVRSGCWNKALVLAEAGVEEALAQLNDSLGLWSSNGWTLGGGQHSKQRTLGSDKYLILVTTNPTNPVIVATASVLIPASSNWLARSVRVQAQQQSAGFRGMVAKGKVSINGSARTDSFNSADPLYSTLGHYDSAKARAYGEVYSASTTASAVELSGSAQVNGILGTGHSSVLKIDMPASIGSQSWTANIANAGKVEPGYHKTDFSRAFTNVIMPSTAGAFAIGGGTVGGTNYTVLLNASKTYYTSTLALKGSQKMLVSADATLIITDTLDVTGNSQIIIGPTGRLTVYVEKSAVILGGGIANSSGNAKNFTLYGSSNCTKVYYGGNGNLVGTVYAPSAKMELTGNSHFMGASVSQEIVLGGDMHFHYDEALWRRGAVYLVTSWDEI